MLIRFYIKDCMWYKYRINSNIQNYEMFKWIRNLNFCILGRFDIRTFVFMLFLNQYNIYFISKS